MACLSSLEVLEAREVVALIRACGRGPAGVRNAALIAIMFGAGLSLRRTFPNAGPGEATIRPSQLPILGCWSTRRHPIDVSAPIHSVSRDRKGAAAVDAVGEVERNPETARPK